MTRPSSSAGLGGDLALQANNVQLKTQKNKLSQAQFSANLSTLCQASLRSITEHCLPGLLPGDLALPAPLTLRASSLESLLQAGFRSLSPSFTGTTQSGLPQLGLILNYLPSVTEWANWAFCLLLALSLLVLCTPHHHLSHSNVISLGTKGTSSLD